MECEQRSAGGDPGGERGFALCAAAMRHWDAPEGLRPQLSGMLRQLPATRRFCEAKEPFERLEALVRLALCEAGVYEPAWRCRLEGDRLVKEGGGESVALTPGFDAHLPRIRSKLQRASLRSIDRLVVYGGGTHTLMLWPVLLKTFGGVDLVLDRQPERAVFKGRELIGVEAFEPRPDDLVVLSSMCYEREMRVYLQKRFGVGLRILSLYDVSSWEVFERELLDERTDANLVFDLIKNWMDGASHPEWLNAGAWLLQVQTHLSGAFRRPNAAMGAGLGTTELRRFLRSRLFESWQAEIEVAAARLGGARRVAWFDCYVLGDYMREPALRFVDLMLRCGCDHVVVLISDKETELRLTEPWDRRVSLVRLIVPPGISQVLGVRERMRLDYNMEEMEASPEPLRGYLNDVAVGVPGMLAEGELIEEALSRLSQKILPALFANQQDNRLVSRHFHCWKSRPIPTVQLQHGILSSGLYPLWADRFLGWKDAHSKGAYAALARHTEGFVEMGNYNANALLERAKEVAPVFDESEQGLPVFVFFFQGPPFWHVTYSLIKHGMEMVMEAASRMETQWRFAIKMRKPNGESLILDFLERYQLPERLIEILPADLDNAALLKSVSAVGVISTSAAQEAAAFGVPVVSIESRRTRGIVRLSEWGLGEPVRDADELVGCLERIRSTAGSLSSNGEAHEVCEADETMAVTRMRECLERES